MHWHVVLGGSLLTLSLLELLPSNCQFPLVVIGDVCLLSDLPLIYEVVFFQDNM